MGGLSIWHWLIVLVVVVLIFGTKKLRNVGQDLGGAVKGFKEGMKSGDDAATPAKEADAPSAQREHICSLREGGAWALAGIRWRQCGYHQLGTPQAQHQCQVPPQQARHKTPHGTLPSYPDKRVHRQILVCEAKVRHTCWP